MPDTYQDVLFDRAVMSALVNEEARSWIGTPWVNQGRTKGLGVDCVGLIFKVGLAVGAIPPDTVIPNNYKLRNDGTVLEEFLSRYMDKISDWRNAQPPDVLVMSYNPQFYWHCMILTARDNDNFTVIEAGKPIVSERRIDNSHKRRIHSAYRIRGIKD